MAVAAPLQQSMEKDAPPAFDRSARMKEIGLVADPDQFACCPCGWCTIVPDNHQAALFRFGQYQGTLKQPGPQCIGCCIEPTMVKLKMFTLDCQKVKVLDLKGNPVMISGVATYHATSAKKPLTDVSNPWPGMCEDGQTSFLELQAAAVLKRVAAKYPYEAPPGEPSLLADASGISQAFRDELQQAVMPTGAVIVSFDLTDLSYAPEIAQAMLARQQAEAAVQARKLVVEAAVQIAEGAVVELKKLGRNFDKDVEARIISNLMTTIVSTQTATPTMPMV